MLNPSAGGRVVSIVDAKRRGSELGGIGGDLRGDERNGALSSNIPVNFCALCGGALNPRPPPPAAFGGRQNPESGNQSPD